MPKRQLKKKGLLLVRKLKVPGQQYRELNRPFRNSNTFLETPRCRYMAYHINVILSSFVQTSVVVQIRIQNFFPQNFTTIPEFQCSEIEFNMVSEQPWFKSHLDFGLKQALNLHRIRNNFPQPLPQLQSFWYSGSDFNIIVSKVLSCVLFHLVSRYT